jgi:lipopolysaccharide/colanic/teichoic acid biosynthesis glycosyltransferase
MVRQRELVWERDLRTLYSPQEIQAILRRERGRADRGKREFSMVVVELEEGGKRLLDRLTRMLLSRARCTDEIGWFSSERPCVVLPDTGTPGACCFAESICELARQNTLRIVCNIYTYPNGKVHPEDTAGGERDPLRQGLADRGEPERLRRMPNEIAPQEAPAVGYANQRSEDSERIDAESRQQATRTHSLDPLFIAPLPTWKRVLDVIGATVGLVVSAPIVAAAVALIKLTSRGPAMFLQQRAGLGGRPFSIYKLRTMVADAEQQQAGLRGCSEQDGPAFKMTSDPRVTAVGRCLRVMSLDELPQFWNVLKGNMSLVGPRPLPLAESDACAQWHRRRLDVTPGLTCIWQVRGRSRVTFDEWMRMDMEYIGRRTLLHDLILLLLTIPAVLLRRGAH